MKSKIFILTILVLLNINIKTSQSDNETDMLNRNLLNYASHSPHLNGLIDVINNLLNRGANKIDEALLRALQAGNFELIQLLLKLGANPNFQEDVESKWTSSNSLGHVMEFQSLNPELPEIVKLLLEAGASTDIQNYKGESFLSLKDKYLKSDNEERRKNIARKVEEVYLEHIKNLNKTIMEAIPNMPRDLANVISEYTI